MRELSSLIGLQVIATQEGKRLGTVSDALIDLAQGRLVALMLAKTPEPSVVLAEDIDVIGPDAIMIFSGEKVRTYEEAAEALAHGKSVLEQPPAVMTSKGIKLGELGAVHVEEGSGRIARFFVSAGPLKDVTEGALALPVVEGIVHGEDTVIVPHEVVARRLEQAGGLRGALRSLAHRLRARYQHASERSEQLLEQSGRRLKSQAEQAREKAAKLAEEAREKARKAAQEAKEKVDDLAEEAKEAVERARHEPTEAEKEEKPSEDADVSSEVEVEDSGGEDAAQSAADEMTEQPDLSSEEQTGDEGRKATDTAAEDEENDH